MFVDSDSVLADESSKLIGWVVCLGIGRQKVGVSIASPIVEVFFRIVIKRKMFKAFLNQLIKSFRSPVHLSGHPQL
jgi:hypothetical protein